MDKHLETESCVQYMATLMQIRYLMMSIYIAIFSAVFIYGLEHFKVDSMRTMGIQFFLIFMTIFYWIIEYRTVKQWIGYREYLKKVEDLIRVANKSSLPDMGNVNVSQGFSVTYTIHILLIALMTLQVFALYPTVMIHFNY